MEGNGRFPSGGALSRGALTLLGGVTGPAISEFGDNPPWPLPAGKKGIPCTSLCVVGGGCSKPFSPPILLVEHVSLYNARQQGADKMNITNDTQTAGGIRREKA